MMRWRLGKLMDGRPVARAAALLALALMAAVIASGCDVGDDDGGTRRAAPETPTSTASDAATKRDDADDAAEPAERTPAQAREAIATGRALDQLAAVYGPVSARINFLVAADTLRRDAIETKADDAVLRERAGAVRVEVRRMRPLLVTAQRGLARLVAARPGVRRVQASLMAATAARLRALDRLEAVLDAEGDELSNGEVDDLDTEFRIAWDESLRATREATTEVQEVRAALGLDPAPEEALR